MEATKNLYIKGAPEALSEFVVNIGNFAAKDWKFVNDRKGMEKYLWFVYEGDLVEKANVTICFDGRIEKGELKVGNIIPIEKEALGKDEYDAILIQFYKDIINPNKKHFAGLTLNPPK